MTDNASPELIVRWLREPNLVSHLMQGYIRVLYYDPTDERLGSLPDWSLDIGNGKFLIYKGQYSTVWFQVLLHRLSEDEMPSWQDMVEIQEELPGRILSMDDDGSWGIYYQMVVGESQVMTAEGFLAALKSFVAQFNLLKVDFQSMEEVQDRIFDPEKLWNAGDDDEETDADLDK